MSAVPEKPRYGPNLLQLAFERDPKDFVRVMLFGKFDRGGSVDGHAIPVMPQLDRLSDRQIADLINELFGKVAERRLKADRPVLPITGTQVSLERKLSEPPRDSEAMTAAEYDRASDLYFHTCADCHGVRREGGGGPPLYDFWMERHGTEGLSRIVHYGSPNGMPGWDSDRQMPAGDMNMLARFLQQPAPLPPVYTQREVLDSWQLLVPVSERPRRRQFPVVARDLFVTLLHDVGEVLLIDGRSKSILSRIQVDPAPHEIELSHNGRYLYVMSRGAKLSLIDLYMAEPRVVARVRVATVGRALALGRNRNLRRNLLVAGGSWPPQYAVLNPLTLKPLATELLDAKAYESGLTGADITQIAGLTGRNRFALITQTEGQIHQRAFDRRGSVIPRSVSLLEGPSFLRPGAFDRSGNSLLLPAGDGQVLVFDTVRGQLVASVVAPHVQGGTGSSVFVDPEFGSVWAVGSLRGDVVTLVATDSDSEQAWRVVRQLELPGAGSLSLATHSDSSNLWLDVSLNDVPDLNEYGHVFSLHNLDAAPARVPIAAWAGLAGKGARVLHPQFNSAGNELWFTVWNQRNRQSAIVVVDDEKRALKAVIKDERLVTPIRTFGLGEFLKRMRR